MVRFDIKEYYKRQVALHELGLPGQQKLRRSKVTVVGLGGLGSAATLYLALAGIGHLRLVDQDTVELSNLHRQVLYGVDDLRFPKVEAAAKRVGQMNPEVHVEAVPRNIRKANVEEILDNTDCLVDGLDNMHTRYLINRVCVEKRIPYVYASAIGIEGYLSVFNSPETPCLKCVFPNLEDRYLSTCETRGVFGATTGIIGAMEAMEAIKVLASVGDTLKNTLLVCDFYDMTMVRIEVFKDPECSVCAGGRTEKISGVGERLVWLCGQNTVNVNPKKPLKLSINNIYDRLSRHFKIMARSSSVVVFKHNDAEVSLFKGGRMLIKNIEGEREALEVYRNVRNIFRREGKA